MRIVKKHIMKTACKLRRHAKKVCTKLRDRRVCRCSWLGARIEVTVGDVTDGARCLGHELHHCPLRIEHEGRCDALEITLVPVVLHGLRALVEQGGGE